MDIVDLDDFIEIYPQQDNVYFNAWLNRKKEFSELRAPLIEPPPGKGKVFIHQEFAKRFLSVFDRLLVYHQAGTGKTRLIVHSREYFKRYHNKHKRDTPGKDKHTIKKAYILTSGKLLQDTFTDEILKHVAEDYHPSHIRRIPEEKREKAIKRKIREFYTIRSYHEFAQEVKSLSDQQLETMMSDVIVYVDEVHSTSTLDVREGREVKQQENENHVEIYDSLHRAFQFGKRNKIVLLTATPMINRSLDYNSVINLILPPQMQMPIEEVDDYKRYIQGRVSYIRRQFTGAIPKYMGVEVGKDPIVVWKCPMREHQKQVYLRTSRRNFETGRLQTSNFAFPFNRDIHGNELSRSEVYDLYIQKNRRNEVTENPDGTTLSRVFNVHNTGLPQLANNEYGRQLANLLSVRGNQPLRDLSEKFYQIFTVVENKWFDINKHTPGTPVPDSKGICFIYSNYVKFGADLLALVFQYNGYRHYDERGLNVYERGFTKRKRFALITSDTPPDIANSAFRTMNDPRNRFGEYLQVIIGSNITGKGVSINNASAVIFVTPEWNRTNEEQARDRVFRSTSAVDRLEHKREFGLEEVMDVEIYRMVSTLEEEESVDIHLYETSQNKSKDIANVVRQNKIYSVDSLINYERNVQPRDEPFSEICDYQQCDYIPYIPELPEQAKIVDDYAGKIMNYLHEEVKLVREVISRLFKKRNSFSVNGFLSIFSEVPTRGKITMDRKYVLNALEIILSDLTKQRFVDCFGRRIYLREEDDILFTTTDLFDLSYSSDDSVYTGYLMASVNSDEGNILKEFIQKDDQDVVVNFINKMKGLDQRQIKYEFSRADQNIRARVFERLFERYFHRRDDDNYLRSRERKVADAVYSIYGRYLISFDEPVDLINKGIERRSVAKRGRRPGIVSGGRRKVDSTKFYTDHIPKPLDPVRDRRRVYIHTLDPMELTKHQLPNFLKARGVIRVFKVSEGRWRIPNLVEYNVYVDKIQKHRNDIVLKLADKYEYIGSLAINIPGTDITVIRLRDERGKWTPGKNIGSFTTGDLARFQGHLRKHPLYEQYIKANILSDKLWSAKELQFAYMMLGVYYDGSYEKSVDVEDKSFIETQDDLGEEFQLSTREPEEEEEILVEEDEEKEYDTYGEFEGDLI